MNSMLIRLGLTALIIAGLAGCGGTSIGVTGVNSSSSGSSGTIVAGATDVRTLSTADFQALRPVVTVQSVTIPTPASGVAGTPVVKYTVVDQNGHPVVGLGGQYVKAAANDTNVTQGLPYNFDISFTLAKLIPAANGEPSRWVNYLVTKLAATSTPASAVVANGGVAWTGTYPTTDSNGTIVDHGDGTYQYTFLHDVTQIQNVVKSLPSTYTVGSSTYNTVDLDIANLNYDATATTRLGVLLTGSQPGTGTAVPGGVQPSNGPNPVPLVYTVSEAFDFVPNGSPVTNTREIVTAGSCDGCHDNVTQKRGLGHISTASATNGIPPGAYVGRNNPRLCVACHTDQAKFGFPVVTSTTNADGSPAYSGAYYRVDETTVPAKNGAAFIYPRMIHQTHMGNQLVKTGYNLNNHCSGDTLATNGAQCFNQVGFPQERRDCTKCHDGNATKSDGSTNTNITTNGNNWKMVPSQLACGACHDGINFITGQGITLANRDADVAAGKAVGTTATGHGAGQGLPDNSQCTICHKTGGLSADPLTDITVAHAVTTTTLNSVALQSNVDTVIWKISKVALNATGNPVITFQLNVNGTAVTKLNPTQTYTNATTGQTVVDPNPAMLTQFPELAGNMPIIATFAVPQDGLVTPADFNARFQVSLASILVASGSPKAGYLDPVNNPLSGGVYIADSNNNFTATLTGDTVGQAVGTGCAKPTAPAVATCVNTAVLATPVVVPAKATMLTGALVYSFIQTNLSAYPYNKANVTVNPNVNVASVVENVGTGTGGLAITPLAALQAASGGNALPGSTNGSTTGRRIVTSVTLCNNCHDRLGTFWESTSNPVFHSLVAGTTGALAGAGERNEPNECPICHTAIQVDGSGVPADISTWVHGIHAGSKRVVPFTAHNTDFSTLLYPGQLKDCNQCHQPNTVNFGATGGGLPGSSASVTLQSKLLWSYAATGTMATTSTYLNPVASLISGLPTSNIGKSIWINVGQNYGNTFGYTGQGVTLSSYTSNQGNNTGGLGAAASAVVPTQVAPVGGLYKPADKSSLVNSPITSACTACHNDQTALNHITSSGGSFYATRGSVDDGSGNIVSKEGCLACHGQGTIMDAAVIHQQQ